MKTALTTFIAIQTLVNISQAAIEEHYEEKAITIQEADPFESAKHVVIRAGKEVSFKITIFQTEFLGYDTILANAFIDNSTKDKVKTVYSISFHDKDGKLVGCYQSALELDANDDANVCSGIIFGTPESFKTVTNYKLRTQVLESKKK